MPKEVIFEELEDKEKILILRAFDYDVDEKGFILEPSGRKIPSQENPKKHLTLKTAAFETGSLKLMEASTTAISKFLRENLEE